MSATTALIVCVLLSQTAVVNLDNENIIRDHVVCALCEFPLHPSHEAPIFGGTTRVATALARVKALGLAVPSELAGDAAAGTGVAVMACGVPWGATWCRNPVILTPPEPWSRVSLRAIGEQFTVVDDGCGGAEIDQLDAHRAFYKVSAALRRRSRVGGDAPDASRCRPTCTHTWCQAHEGAIYLNQGVQYVVEKLDLNCSAPAVVRGLSVLEGIGILISM